MIREDKRVAMLEHDLLRERRSKESAFEASELHRRFHMAEVREVNRLNQLVAHLESEMEFIKEQLGAARFDALVEKHQALVAAGMRRITGYMHTERGDP